MILNIPIHIGNLLYIHDCVIIPGFGGFVSNISSAEIKNKQNSFLPPSKSIVFNKNLRINDGLLVNYISEISGVNFVEAKLLVEDFVDNTNKRLSLGEKVVFENIGYFVTNTDGALQFEPDSSSNFLLDSFGLTSFHFPELESKEVIRRSKKFSDAPSERKTLTRKVIRRTLIVAPLLLVLAILPTSEFYTTTSSLNPFGSDSASDIVTVEKTVEDMTVKRNALFYSSQENRVVEVIEEAIAEVEKEAVVVKETVKVEENNFFLIAGSFTDIENANILVGQLNNKGYSAEVLKENKNRYRVSIESFKTKKAARDKLMVFRGKDNGLSLWLLAK